MRRAAMPWLLLAIVTAVAFLLEGWSPWLTRFLQLTIAYVLASAAYGAFARARSVSATHWEALAGFLCAMGGAAIASGLLRIGYAMEWMPRENFGFDFGLASAFAATLLVPQLMQRESRRRLERDKQVAELKLRALEAQIEPHFLYNTLANVQQLLRSNPAEADRMLETLIRYLKVVIPDVRNGRSTLGDEIERVESYLSIMRMRMGERLRYRIDVDAALHPVAVPPLSVITLVENAVKHGLDPVPAGGSVVISARRDDGRVRVQVADDGAGFGDDVGTGTGLQNLRERLATLYGERGALDLEHRSPSGVQAVLTVPA